MCGVCVCVCVRACVRVCVCTCMYVCMHACVSTCVQPPIAFVQMKSSLIIVILHDFLYHPVSLLNSCKCLELFMKIKIVLVIKYKCVVGNFFK